jgi:hypothetical protein
MKKQANTSEKKPVERRPSNLSSSTKSVENMNALKKPATRPKTQNSRLKQGKQRETYYTKLGVSLNIETNHFDYRVTQDFTRRLLVA